MAVVHFHQSCCAVYLSDETKWTSHLQGTLTVVLTIAADMFAESLHLTILHLQENKTSGTSNVSHIPAEHTQHFEQALQMTAHSMSRTRRGVCDAQQWQLWSSGGHLDLQVWLLRSALHHFLLKPVNMLLLLASLCWSVAKVTHWLNPLPLGLAECGCTEATL